MVGDEHLPFVGPCYSQVGKRDDPLVIKSSLFWKNRPVGVRCDLDAPASVVDLRILSHSSCRSMFVVIGIGPLWRFDYGDKESE